MKVTEKMIGILKELGANEWHKGNHNRLYLNEAVDALIGLETECYKSGNIKSAWLKGERISNAEAGRIIERTCKAYIDIDTMELVTTNELLMTAVEEKEAEIAAEEAEKAEEAEEEVEDEAAVEETAEEATANENAENSECTFERVQGENGRSGYLCSNGKQIERLGPDEYAVDGQIFKCLRFAKNYCLGRPLDWGMKKLIIPNPPVEG